jgi:uncharacterized surface protein with fasciclin (FAS1) repeats
MRHRLASSLLAALLAIGIVAGPASAADPTIADIAVGNGHFTTLVAALSCSGLVPAVADPSASLTVFAPTDAAFKRLGLSASNVCSLPKSALTNILLYHVAPGELLAADVLASRRIRMLNGGLTFPRVIWGAPRINLYARIVATDIRASNGVIHVINAVLLPIGVH